jgi:hypothetical protein
LEASSFAVSFLDEEPSWLPEKPSGLDVYAGAEGEADAPDPWYGSVEAGSAACGHWFSVIVALFRRRSAGDQEPAVLGEQ